MNERIVVVVTEGGAQAPLTWLKERVTVVEAAADTAEFAVSIGRAAGLLVRTYTCVDERLLDKAPYLKVVGRAGVGLENIDVAACKRRNVRVVYTPDANTLAVGDFVFGAILRLIRPWGQFSDAAHPPAEFKRIRNTQSGRQLNELTLGILGMGRVGRRVGRIAAVGFGMRVLYHDILDVQSSLDFPATACAKADLLRQSDILTLHTDMRPGNRHLIGAKDLALLPDGAIVINHARGELLDVQALAAELKTGRLAGAAIDVYDPEPPGEDFPLLRMPNVLLTPHMAARTTTALENMSWVVKDVMAVLEGREPRYPATV